MIEEISSQARRGWPAMSGLELRAGQNACDYRCWMEGAPPLLIDAITRPRQRALSA